MFTTMARVAPEKTHPLRVLPLSPYAGIEQRAIMAKMTYAEQLRHPNWQRRRLQILEQSNFTCGYCGSADTTLHVHHKFYRKGRMAWDYEDHELEPLCEDCHKEKHGWQEIIEEIVAEMGPHEIAGLIAGYATRSGYCGPKRSAELFNLNRREFAIGYMAGEFERKPDWVKEALAKLKEDLGEYDEWAAALKEKGE